MVRLETCLKFGASLCALHIVDHAGCNAVGFSAMDTLISSGDELFCWCEHRPCVICDWTIRRNICSLTFTLFYFHSYIQLMAQA
jgi:hypothetical protein